MSVDTLSAISNSLRKSASWADDDEDDWDYNTWKQQIEDDTVTATGTISADIGKLAHWADDEEDWDLEDWKEKVEDFTSTPTVEEPMYETGYYYNTFQSSDPPLEDDLAPYYTYEQQQQVTYDPAAAYFNEDPPTMHWYCIGKAEGDDRPQNWRYEYSKTWRTQRMSQPTHSKTHPYKPLVSSPLTHSVLTERGNLDASSDIEGLVNQINVEHQLSPDNIQSTGLVTVKTPISIATLECPCVIETQKNERKILPMKAPVTIAPAEKPILTAPLDEKCEIHPVPITISVAPIRDSTVNESKDLRCEDSDDSAPPEWEHSSSSRPSSPFSDSTTYEADFPLLSSAKEPEGTIDSATDGNTPISERRSASWSSYVPLDGSKYNATLSIGSRPPGKAIDFKKGAEIGSIRCKSLPNISTLGLRGTTGDFLKILSDVTLTSAATENCGQHCALLTTLSKPLFPNKEPPIHSTWLEYTQIGIAAAASVAVAGGLFLAFGRRKC